MTFRAIAQNQHSDRFQNNSVALTNGQAELCFAAGGTSSSTSAPALIKARMGGVSAQALWSDCANRAELIYVKMLQDQPLLAPDRIGTDEAGPYPPAIAESQKEGLLPRAPIHHVTKHLQQGIESDYSQVKRPVPHMGGFQSFNTARRTIQGFEAMLWLRKGFGFAGVWTVREQNQLLAQCFGLSLANKA